jgi:AraC-like DNA-binding protein
VAHQVAPAIVPISSLPRIGSLDISGPQSKNQRFFLPYCQTASAVASNFHNYDSITAGAGLLRLMFSFRPESMLLIPLCFSIIVYVAGYMALRHPEALTGVDESALSKKYEKSNLTAERAEVYLKKLLHVMKTERPYIDGDLTLQKLADRLSIPVNHLSQIINERLGQNFFDFINSYRVKEAQELLVDAAKKHYTVIAIAEEVVQKRDRRACEFF